MAEHGGRDTRDQIGDGSHKIGDAFVEGGGFFFSGDPFGFDRCAVLFELQRVLLGDLQQLVDFFFLQNLRGEELFVVVAELFMIGNEDFESSLDPVHARVAISVSLGHISKVSAAALREDEHSCFEAGDVLFQAESDLL